MSIRVENLNAWFGDNHVLKDIHLQAADKEVMALIGPSGCGKSTFLRCINRLHEETPNATSEGAIYIGQGHLNEDINDRKVDAVTIRRKVGMVFQKPIPFPGLSIYENVIAGLRLSGVRNKTVLKDEAEQALKKAALWDEVKDKLDEPGTSLSGGQQQRLCIARALAMHPPILLLDEPTSALDPISTAGIEDLIKELKKSVTIIIVTHNMQQAQRIADKTAFFYLGKLIEVGTTEQIFKSPQKTETQRYIAGRFG
jgi:phosphate transport system ATP-binding protein